MRNCETCCKKCQGSGTVDGGDFGGPEVLVACDACDGDGQRRCDSDGCRSLAKVAWPTNSDMFCEACTLADVTTYFEALKLAKRAEAARAARPDGDGSALPAFRLGAA